MGLWGALACSACSGDGAEGVDGRVDTRTHQDGVIFVGTDTGGDALIVSDGGGDGDGGGPGCDCEEPTPRCQIDGTCVQCLVAADCDGAPCVGGACEATCSPGAVRCQDDAVLTCDAAGRSWQPTQLCQADQQCAGGRCLSCQPGARRCIDTQQTELCDAEGRWSPGEACVDSGLACLAGRCVSPCVTGIKSQTNSGCDYWAVDLDNHYGAQNGPFAVIVSNLSDYVATVDVTARDAAGAAIFPVASAQVAPGGLQVIALPQRNMAGGGVFWSAYRVQSSAPIIAYQFNPLDNVDVFSNDASLLLPTNTWGTEYMAVSRFEFVGAGPNGTTIPYRGTVSVLASSATQVHIRPTARTLAGPQLEAMLPGQTYTYALAPYQVLNIKSDQDKGDLTGTAIWTESVPVAVFSGHEAAISGVTCCADHLEEQLFPRRTWGRIYVASRSQPRLIELDYWRVVAAEEGTQLVFDPPVASPVTLGVGEFFEVATEQDFVLASSKPVIVAQVLASSHEIVVPTAYSSCDPTIGCHPSYSCEATQNGGYICVPPWCAPSVSACPSGHRCHCVGSGSCRCAPTGDPALILAPPVEQYRDEYVFLTPNKYEDDYINVVTPLDAAVVLDGLLIPDGNFDVIPGTSWRVARLGVTDGVHHLIATAPVGVTVYGYDRDVSYGYPAGLNLEDL